MSVEREEQKPLSPQEIFTGVADICAEHEEQIQKDNTAVASDKLKEYLYLNIFGFGKGNSKFGIDLTLDQRKKIDDEIKKAVEEYRKELNRGKTKKFLRFLAKWTAGLVLKILSFGKINIMKGHGERFQRLEEYAQGVFQKQLKEKETREANERLAKKFAKEKYDEYLKVSTQQIKEGKYDATHRRGGT